MITGNKDLDLIILNKLDDKDLVNVCKTNTQANILCNDQTFWLNRIMIKFPYLGLDILKTYKGKKKNWSQYYIKILRKLTPETANKDLINAARNGFLDRVIISLYNGADINYKGGTAIIFAAGNNHLHVVKYLADGNFLPFTIEDAIYQAVSKGHLDVVKYLIGRYERLFDKKFIKI